MIEYDVYEVRPEETQEIPTRSGALEASFLMKPLGDLMHRKLVSAGEQDSIALAAKYMSENGTYCVVVMEGGHILGILTERDIVTKVVVNGLNPAEEKIVDHMTRFPETLQCDDAVAYALSLMDSGSYRHVPIESEDGKLVGVFSVRDLQSLILGQFEKEVSTLPPKPMRVGPDNRYSG